VTNSPLVVTFTVVSGLTVASIKRHSCYAPPVREGDNKRCFCPSVCPSVRPSVYPSVAYIANNSRTRRPSVLKFGTTTNSRSMGACIIAFIYTDFHGRSITKISRRLLHDMCCIAHHRTHFLFFLRRISPSSRPGLSECKLLTSSVHAESLNLCSTHC